MPTPNSISLASVSELLDGRHFFIPAYQRGYRWSDRQVQELLSDLYEFAARTDKQPGEFYCLQPLIIRRDPSKDDTYEVIDGQQRLTTLLILLAYLRDRDRGFEGALAEDGMAPYSLLYETRPSTETFLQRLSTDTLSHDNIDADYISRAFEAVREWFDHKGPNLAGRYGLSVKQRELRERLSKLLLTEREARNEKYGTACFILYELAPDAEHNPVEEFLNINNGRIPLTESELVKALLLQKRNFFRQPVSGAAEGHELERQSAEQMKIALQWEMMENSLHRDDFWSFLSADSDPDNRMELLLRLRYQTRKNGAEPGEGDLFRHYYNDVLDGRPGEGLQEQVRKEWQAITDLFDTLQQWYEDPVMYNRVGLLIHSGVKLYELVSLYASVSYDDDSGTFEAGIKERIQRLLPGPEEFRNGALALSYGRHTGRIRRLLLWLNIYQKNKQVFALRSRRDADSRLTQVMSPEYKFPFDLYVGQKWDVEHIEALGEGLPDNTEETWQMLDGWMGRLGLDKKDDAVGRAWKNRDKRDSADLAVIWKAVKKANSNDLDKENRDMLENLTLLDASTNRSYGNHVFGEKRKIIKDRMRKGTFVPLCTQMVFDKTFNDAPAEMMDWGENDRKGYMAFIINELKDFYGPVNDPAKPL